MRPSPASRVAALSLCLLIPLAAVASGEAPDEWVIRHERIERSLKAGTPVHVTNLVGDVRVRGVRDPLLTVVSMIQQRRDDPRTAVVHTGEGDTHAIDAAFPGSPPEGIYAPGSAPRVDLTVFVPPDSPVFITTAGGRIEAKGLSSDVTAESDTGRIGVQTPGVVTARSRRGDIDVIIKKLGRGRVFRIESGAGAIRVRLPAEGVARVTAATTRSVASDYTMSIRRQATSSHKTATIHVGTSRLGRWLFGWARRCTKVDLKSEQGEIQVLAPFPEIQES